MWFERIIFIMLWQKEIYIKNGVLQGYLDCL